MKESDVMAKLIKPVFFIILGIALILFIILHIVPALWIGGVFSPAPSFQKIESIFQQDNKQLSDVADYFKNSNYTNIYISKTVEKGQMFAGGEQGNVPIENERIIGIVADLLENNAYSIIGKNDNTVYFMIWSIKDNSRGIVYSDDGNMPKVDFLTDLRPLSEPNWYYYEANFNEWEIRNN